MKQSIALGKVTKFMGLGFLSSIKDLFTGKLEREDFKSFLLKVVVPLASILLYVYNNIKKKYKNTYKKKLHY